MATKVLHSFVFTRWLLCRQIQYLLFILLMAAFYQVVKYDQTAKSVITDLEAEAEREPSHSVFLPMQYMYTKLDQT
jgi:hypothetical protein